MKLSNFEALMYKEAVVLVLSDPALGTNRDSTTCSCNADEFEECQGECVAALTSFSNAVAAELGRYDGPLQVVPYFVHSREDGMRLISDGACRADLIVYHDEASLELQALAAWLEIKWQFRVRKLADHDVDSLADTLESNVASARLLALLQADELWLTLHLDARLPDIDASAYEQIADYDFDFFVEAGFFPKNIGAARAA